MLGGRAFFRYSGVFMLLTVAAYTLWLKRRGGGDDEEAGEGTADRTGKGEGTEAPAG
jgi:hypothetical protein